MDRPPGTQGGGLVIVGASTGGPRTLGVLLAHLPPLNAGVLIVQHMPRMIQDSLVRTLSRQSSLSVDLARDGDRIVPGEIRVAPAEVHCVLEQNSILRLASGPKVNYVCPSVDVTMKSIVAPAAGEPIVGVLLTGMGRDGAEGMAHLRRLGARTVAQDQATCAVFGMPKAAWESGGTELLLPPERIAQRLVQWVGRLSTPDAAASAVS